MDAVISHLPYHIFVEVASQYSEKPKVRYVSDFNIGSLT